MPKNAGGLRCPEAVLRVYVFICTLLDIFFLTQRKRERHRERGDYVSDKQHAVVLCVALCVLCVKNAQ